MEVKVLSTGIPHKSILSSYVRPDPDRSRLSKVYQIDNVPIIDLVYVNRALIVEQIRHACSTFDFFQMSHTGLNRCHAPAQGETEETLDSPELLGVVGAANAPLEIVVDESPVNLGRRVVKKRSRAEYWVAFAYEEYMDEKNCRRARCKHCGTTYLQKLSKG